MHASGTRGSKHGTRSRDRGRNGARVRGDGSVGRGDHSSQHVGNLSRHSNCVEHPARAQALTALTSGSTFATLRVRLTESMARALTSGFYFSSATKPLVFLDPQRSLREE